MSVEAFLDTNVLIYAVSSAASEADKKAGALELVESSDFGLSTQVLQEFYVNFARRIARPLSPDQALALVEQFRCFPTVSTDYPLIVAGIEESIRFGIFYWDGTIVAAAESLEASILFTEDLNHGQHYGSVRAINPFRSMGHSSVHDANSPEYG